MIRQSVLDFKIERTKEQLTAHGGLALLAEYNHGMGLRQLSDQHLPAPGSHRGYAPSAFVESLILMLQAGGQSLEDLRELEQEAALTFVSLSRTMKLVGRDLLPDPDTVRDWLRRMGDPQTDQAGLQGLGQVRDLLNQRLLRHDGITEYTLDADAMQIEGEKREATWTYQGVKGYMPLLGFLFETPVCLLEEFREGHVSPSSDALRFYRHCQQRLPKGKRMGFLSFRQCGLSGGSDQCLRGGWSLLGDHGRPRSGGEGGDPAHPRGRVA